MKYQRACGLCLSTVCFRWSDSSCFRNVIACWDGSAKKKKVARFRECLNIPFCCFKVSLAVWKLKGLDNPHLLGFPDISALGSLLLLFVGTSYAKDLAARCCQLPVPSVWVPKKRQLAIVRNGVLFAHLLWPGTHTRVDCPTQHYASSFAKSIPC